MVSVFLAFAHSQQAPLSYLEEEDKNLFTILYKDSTLNGYQLIRESYADAEIINTRFNAAQGGVAIFHYSGHAGQNSLLIDDKNIHASGIAQHLKKSVDSGALKLVVLNGCSTKGQVEYLFDLGVPAVIATHAPVGDQSACEFAKRFYWNLVEGFMTIEHAFTDALVNAQNATGVDLQLKSKKTRGIQYLPELAVDQPLWELFSKDPLDVKLNPLPRRPQPVASDFKANEKLRDTLFTTLLAAGNSEIERLDKLKNEIFVENADIDNAIVNVLPMPIGEHLRKLFCDTDDPEGADKISLNRIAQICRVHSTTMELLSHVIISQLWEYKATSLTGSLVDMLTGHFSLSSEERVKFNYRQFLLPILNQLNRDPLVNYFISEMRDFERKLLPGEPFSIACDFLSEINSQRIDKTIHIDSIPSVCAAALDKLCDVLKELGFLHRYHLTSVQAISVFKYRHEAKPFYNHSVVKLMRVGGSEKVLYELNNCLSCQGVVLIKEDLKRKYRDQRIFTAEHEVGFLNLSPFLVDVSAFENGSKSRIVSFDIYNEDKDKYVYKDVCRPDSERDKIDVAMANVYQSVKSEMDYYRKEILSPIIKRP